jgi:hypothetical protein
MRAHPTQRLLTNCDTANFLTHRDRKMQRVWYSEHDSARSSVKPCTTTHVIHQLRIASMVMSRGGPTSSQQRASSVGSCTAAQRACSVPTRQAKGQPSSDSSPDRLRAPPCSKKAAKRGAGHVYVCVTHHARTPLCRASCEPTSSKRGADAEGRHQGKARPAQPLHCGTLLVRTAQQRV